jgi:hypothetical protein
LALQTRSAWHSGVAAHAWYAALHWPCAASVAQLKQVASEPLLLLVAPTPVAVAVKGLARHMSAEPQLPGPALQTQSTWLWARPWQIERHAALEMPQLPAIMHATGQLHESPVPVDVTLETEAVDETTLVATVEVATSVMNPLEVDA